MNVLFPGTVSLSLPPIRRYTGKNKVFSAPSFYCPPARGGGDIPSSTRPRLPLSSGIDDRLSPATGAGPERFAPAPCGGREG